MSRGMGLETIELIKGTNEGERPSIGLRVVGRQLLTRYTHDVFVARQCREGEMHILASVCLVSPHLADEEEYPYQQANVTVGLDGRITKVQGWAYRSLGGFESRIPSDTTSYPDLSLEQPTETGDFGRLVIASQSPLVLLCEKSGLPTTLIVGREVLPGISSYRELFEEIKRNCLAAASVSLQPRRLPHRL